jgi:hypothetical protein
MSVESAPTTTASDLGPFEDMGPIDFLCIEFPHRRIPGTGIKMLLDLVDRAIVRVLDFVIIRKEQDGTIHRVDMSELGPDFAVFDGASSGMLDEEDVANAADLIGLDSAAALLVYENHWAAPLARTLRQEGAQLVASDRLSVQAILAALDETEPK